MNEHIDEALELTRLEMDGEVLRAKLNQETGQIPWKELQRFFAAGKVVAVAPGLDLVEVAYCIATDRKAEVEAWMKSGRLAPVSDGQARQWFETDARLWAVVVKPWVLVQAQADNS